MVIHGKEFVLARKDRKESVVIVDSSLKRDFSSGEWLVMRIKELFGAEVGIAKEYKEVKKQNCKQLIIGMRMKKPKSKAASIMQKLI